MEKQKHHVLTLFEAQKLHDPFERSFAVTAIRGGLTVESGRCIETSHPVRDKSGQLRKTKTNPDFFVIDRNRGAHVEVGRGNGVNPSKRAQFRVVKAAHVENYTQLSGRTVLSLEPVPDKIVASVIRRILKWK